MKRMAMLVGISLMVVLSTVFVEGADVSSSKNLMVNPGAEGIIQDSEKRFFIVCGGKLPHGWGWGAFLSAGKGIWGVTDKEAHSGKYSAFLTFKEFMCGMVKGEYMEIAAMGLLLGESNVYTGKYAIQAQPDTTYTFSFWLKGNIPSLHFQIKDWDTGKTDQYATSRVGIKGLKKDGSTVKKHPRHGYKIIPTSEWSQYTGKFTTLSTTEKFAIYIGFNTPMFLASHQTFYVDDVTISVLPTLE